MLCLYGSACGRRRGVGAGRRKPTGIEGCAEALPAGFTEIPGCLFPDRQYALAFIRTIADIACTVMRKIRIYVISGDSTGLS